MTTAPAPAMEDSQGGETERANGVECDAHVSSEQLHCESDAVGSTVTHNDVPQNGSTAQLSDSTSSDEEDDSNRTDTGGGYVLLSQEDLHENESCSCIDDCTATVEVLESSTCSGEQGLLHTGTEQNVVTRFADPGAVIAPVTKMEGDEVSAIMKAMSGFSLPATVTPDWARVIPEDVWKAELLARLRNHSKYH